MRLIKTNIVVKELVLKNKNLQGQFNIQHRINLKTGKVNEKVYFSELSFEICDIDNNKMPLDLSVIIIGQFEFENVGTEDEVNGFLSKQAVHILYPYLRSVVSGLTSLAMLPPILIPIVDAHTLFSPKNDKKAM
ncbi:MAG: protein-export chaperone SecB [Acholeplasma sp.]|jgi:preprotein translocase subunit SecB|nr:protein-export chaperone SecB [Acholeplasma sp.]